MAWVPFTTMHSRALSSSATFANTGGINGAMHENIVGIDAAIFMHPTVWKASGTLIAFNDPLIDNKILKKDTAPSSDEEHVAKIESKIDKKFWRQKKDSGKTLMIITVRATNGRVVWKSEEVMYYSRFKKRLRKMICWYKQLIIDLEIVWPVSGSRNWTDVRQFTWCFQPSWEASEESSTYIYGLRQLREFLLIF